MISQYEFNKEEMAQFFDEMGFALQRIKGMIKCPFCKHTIKKVSIDIRVYHTEFSFLNLVGIILHYSRLIVLTNLLLIVSDPALRSRGVSKMRDAKVHRSCEE